MASRYISQAAFSNYKLWESLGFLTAFITSATGVNMYFCMTNIKRPITQGMAVNSF